jgi:hypothetical protein
MLADFEVGYDRVRQMEDIEMFARESSSDKEKEEGQGCQRHPTVKCGFIFSVPRVENRITHLQPMLHLMQCVLEWGGEQMAMDFVHNKQLSPYFLKHTPSSRRPWLFRKGATLSIAS